MNITGRYQRVVELYEYYSQGKLDLTPIYQRNSVWDEKMRSYLIDTLLRGYTMPPIFIRSVVNNTTRQTQYEVLDGQQRLTSIFKYINDEFVVKKMHNEDFYNTEFSDLPDEAKSLILNFEVSVMDVSNAKEAEIYELFARLNSNNIRLNNQEIRSSKYHGQFKMYIVAENKRWSEHIFTPYNMFSKTKKARMDDIEFLSQLAMLSYRGVTEGGKKDLDQIYKELDDEDIPEVLKNNMDKLFEVFNSSSYSELVTENSKYSNRAYMYLFASFYLKIDIDVEEFTKYIKWFIERVEQVENDIIEDKNISELLKIITMRTTNKTSREKRLMMINEAYKTNYLR